LKKALVYFITLKSDTKLHPKENDHKDNTKILLYLLFLEYLG